MFGISARHRIGNVDKQRFFHGVVPEIGQPIIKDVIDKFGPHEQNVYRYIVTGGYLESEAA